MSAGTDDGVLHVVVGHGLPGLFLNTVRSVLALLPAANLLVIDNASPQPELRRELARMEARYPRTRLVRRERNELANAKVGGLYVAYELACSVAAEEGFRYLHLMQGDMQMLWWDSSALDRAEEIYSRQPNCINIVTMALSRDRSLAGELSVDAASGLSVLTRYGITDTGLFALSRWQASGLRFGSSESEHAGRALEMGYRAVVLACPTEVQVPWPAVVRKGRQVGREVRTDKPFLCRPLDDEAKQQLKRAALPVVAEEVAIPWGWTCLSPLWNSDLDNVYYLALRRKDIATNGLRKGLPRWERRGLDHGWAGFLRPHRPSLARLMARPFLSLARERARRWARAVIGPADGPG